MANRTAGGTEGHVVVEEETKGFRNSPERRMILPRNETKVSVSLSNYYRRRKEIGK